MREKKPRSKRRGAQPGSAAEIGFVLPATLVVLSIVLTVALAFAFVTRLELKTARNAVVSTQNRFLAEAGVNYALVRLAQALQASYVDETTLAAASADDVELDGGMFSVSVSDESAKINVNSVGGEVLSRLPGADQTIVDSLLDWRDEDEEPRPSGAETSFYAALDPPYPSKNGPLDTVAEITMVRGVTPEFFEGVRDLVTVYSSDTNLGPDGKPKLNVNLADAYALARRLEGRWSAAEIASVLAYRSGHGPFTSLGELVDVPGLSLEALGRAIDYLTADHMNAERGSTSAGEDGFAAPGRVNVNTASERVLQTLPGMSDDLLVEIMARRGQAPFQGLKDLFGLAAFDRDAARQLLGLVTVQSRTFMIRARGWQKGSIAAQEAAAIVRFGQTGPRILSWRDGWPRQGFQPYLAEAGGHQTADTEEGAR